MRDRNMNRPWLMMRLVTVVTIMAALGVAVPAAASPTSIKVGPNVIKFGTQVVGTDYFDCVEITNASNVPLQFLVEGGLPDDFGFGLFPRIDLPRADARRDPGARARAAGQWCDSRRPRSSPVGSKRVRSSSPRPIWHPGW